MCIIAVKPQGIELPNNFFNTIETCFENNPDGAGYAILKNGSNSVQIEKGFFDAPSLISAIKSEKVSISDILAIHCRIATNGAICSKNCHPFPVSGASFELDAVSIESPYALLHNGIISKYSEDKKTSDTRLFTAELARQKKILSGNVNDIKKYILGEVGSSRIALISRKIKGNYLLVGDWKQENGIYFSNETYKKLYVPSYAFSGYGYGYNSLYDAEIYDEYAPICPVCGEKYNVECISAYHSLYECYSCHAVYDDHKNIISDIL